MNRDSSAANDHTRQPTIAIEQYPYHAWLRIMHQSRDWVLFSGAAAYLRILAADNLEIDEKGVRLIDAPKVPKAPTSTIPARKHL